MAKKGEDKPPLYPGVMERIVGGRDSASRLKVYTAETLAADTAAFVQANRTALQCLLRVGEQAQFWLEEGEYAYAYRVIVDFGELTRYGRRLREASKELAYHLTMSWFTAQENLATELAKLLDAIREAVGE